MLKGIFNVFKKKCPECKSANIENLGETVEGENVKHAYKCLACEHMWYKTVKIGTADDIV